jgi:hypothetical protein
MYVFVKINRLKYTHANEEFSRSGRYQRLVGHANSRKVEQSPVINNNTSNDIH